MLQIGEVVKIEEVEGVETVVGMYYMREESISKFNLEIEINTQGHITINCKIIFNDDDKNKSLVMAGHSL